MDPLSPLENSTPDDIATAPAQDWLTQTIQLRPELLFDIRNQGGRDIYVIEDAVRGKFYQIGANEFELVSRLDGKSTVGEVLNRINEKRKSPLKQEAVDQICHWLSQNNLARVTGFDSCKRLGQQVKSMQKQKMLSFVNPISIKFKLFNPTRLLDASQKYLQWIFSFSFAVIWLVTGTVGLYFLFGNWERLSQSSVGIFAEGRWVWMLVVWLGLKAIHEWAHGIACRRYGGEVPEAGMLLLLFTPMPYVNVTSSWRFGNRWQRFIVAGAGMYVELFVSFIAMILWANVANPLVQDVCFNIFFLSSVTTILFNANPLMRFDGYYMLTDLLNIPNLYTKGLGWFTDRTKNLFFGTPKSKDICPANELPIVRMYGASAFCWKVLVCCTLLIAASVLFYGVGILMAVVGGVLWLAMPILRFFKSVFGVSNRNYSVGRIAVSSTCLVLLVTSVFTWLGSPAKKSAPAIVQFAEEGILRAGGDGFIDEVLVTNWQRVKQGELLLSIRNNELSTEVENLKQLVQEAEIQARIYTNSQKLASAQTSLRKRDSLLIQLAEKQAQLQNLQLTAPFDGIVFRRNLSSIEGQYHSHGTELLRIARSTSQKVIVSIEQNDLDSIQGREGSVMKVVMPGVPTFQAAITNIESRATDQPSHKAFCASYGGPLPVKQLSDDREESPSESAERFQLLSPRFEVELTIESNAGAGLSCGQVGRAFFETKRQSLGQYLYLESYDWFRRQFEQATIGAGNSQ